MAEDFYLDTSIWLDFHENRGRNGELALRLIFKILKENLKIAYSDLHIKELKVLGYSKGEIESFFAIAKPANIIRVHIYKEQNWEARSVSKQRDVPVGDALHAIICRDNFLQFVSRDTDFEKLKDIVEAKKPEDFI
ncbi:PIN domain-containing protein [Candidatus Woesearchaeota archaeon]|nr:PIN domain-containing protein [Candidatus Woesearchaeota archaeon]